MIQIVKKPVLSGLLFAVLLTSGVSFSNEIKQPDIQCWVTLFKYDLDDNFVRRNEPFGRTDQRADLVITNSKNGAHGICHLDMDGTKVVMSAGEVVYPDWIDTFRQVSVTIAGEHSLHQLSGGPIKTPELSWLLKEYRIVTAFKGPIQRNNSGKLVQIVGQVRFISKENANAK